MPQEKLKKKKATRNKTHIHFNRVIIRNVNFGASSFRTVMAYDMA